MSRPRLPITALDTQLRLLRHYTNDPLGHTYANLVVDAALYPNGNVPKEQRHQELGYHCHRQILGAGDTFAVSSDIVSVIEQAAESLPSFVLHAEDLPSLHGFVWLEHPIVVKDVADRNLVVKAFGWTTTQFVFGDGETEPAVIMLAWTDPNDLNDHLNAEVVDSLNAPAGLLSMIAGIFPFNQDWRKLRLNDKGSEASAELGLGRFWLTFLRFIEEPWINAERYTPDRHQAKRAIRTLDHVPAIHVVHLRRRSTSRSSEPGAGNVDWSHRWLVIAHWRNQWYPSLEVHKPRWILEHVKGPESKPLVVHDKVFAVDR